MRNGKFTHMFTIVKKGEKGKLRLETCSMAKD